MPVPNIKGGDASETMGVKYPTVPCNEEDFMGMGTRIGVIRLNNNPEYTLFIFLRVLPFFHSYTP